MEKMYLVKNACNATLSAHNSYDDAQRYIYLHLQGNAKIGLPVSKLKIVTQYNGMKLIGAKATFPCRCFETNKKIFKGDAYFFDVLNKRAYHSSADIVRIYYSNSLTK